MIIREADDSEKKQFNACALHPLGSWEWGQFREKTGLKVLRFGGFDGRKMISSWQLTVHPIPKTGYTVIYFPKGPLPDQAMLDGLKKAAEKENALFVKLEPQVGGPAQEEKKGFEEIRQFLLANGCREGKPLFTPYTFWIDLTKSEDELLAKMRPKTRYNIRLAKRHEVKVTEDNSPKAFRTYLALLRETTQRQGFYAHTLDYHQKMWETLRPDASRDSGQALTAHLLTATYKGKVLVTWVLFSFNGVLYYPYGASSSEHRNLMASNLVMWEAMRFGKNLGLKRFDLWGCLGPNPNPADPWYGFHHFKLGYGPELVEFIGTYDLVINPQLYPLYNIADTIRWKLLRLKTRLDSAGQARLPL